MSLCCGDDHVQHLGWWSTVSCTPPSRFPLPRCQVSWDDVAGLRTAKQALVEAVVLPTLRSDIFQVCVWSWTLHGTCCWV